MTSSDLVEAIKQFHEDIRCCSLSFHGDVVYIGSDRRIIQWNVVTDAVVSFDGYDGLCLRHLNHQLDFTMF